MCENPIEFKPAWEAQMDKLLKDMKDLSTIVDSSEEICVAVKLHIHLEMLGIALALGEMDEDVRRHLISADLVNASLGEL